MAAYNLLKANSETGRWFIHQKNNSVILGPLTAEQIREALRKGLVDPFDGVSREGDKAAKNLIEEEAIFQVTRPFTSPSPELWEVPPWERVSPYRVIRSEVKPDKQCFKESHPKKGEQRLTTISSKHKTEDKTSYIRLASNEVSKGVVSAKNTSPILKADKDLAGKKNRAQYYSRPEK